MAVLTNSLGAYTFRNWIGGPPELLGETLQPLQYAGVDHHAFRIMGKRAAEFEMESIVDKTTALLCYDEYENYKAVVGDGAYQLIWNSLNMDSKNTRYVVQDVRLVEVAKRAVICGAINGGLVDLHCIWRLMAVPYTP